MIQIHWSSVNCPTCGGPIADDKLTPGQRINAIAGLGAQLVEARSVKRAKKAKWSIAPRVLDILVELSCLGAEVESDGFIRS